MLALQWHSDHRCQDLLARGKILQACYFTGTPESVMKCDFWMHSCETLAFFL